MQLTLPPTELFRQNCHHDNAWSDHYGALQTAAAFAGIAVPGSYQLRGIWHHGCFGPWYDFEPGLLTSFAPGAEHRPVFVARQEQADLLQRHGYTRVRAIGLPIIYAPEPAVTRIAGSLLVVPTHSLVGDKYPDRAPFESYAEEILKIAPQFSKVTVCVHPNCAKNGLWVKEFRERGCEIVFGAQTNDANALRRMRHLFAQFETVTTNDWGSHVAYALAFGARVSIHGQAVTSDWRVYLSDQVWATNPGALERSYSPEVLGRKRDFLQRLYVEPTAAVADLALGRWLIGADLRVAPAEMTTVLKALLEPIAEGPMSSDEVRRARQRARVSAAEMVRAGRRPEAVHTLIRAVKAEVATKDLALIVECFVQIGDDLGPLEPEHSAYLLQEAERLARMTGVTVASVRTRLGLVAVAC